MMCTDWFSPAKTVIQTVKQYKALHDENDEVKEAKLVRAKTEALVLEKHEDELFQQVGPYGDDVEFDEERYTELLETFRKTEKFKIASDAYVELLQLELDSNRPDYTLLRRVLRNAKLYRIRSILPLVLKNFSAFIPIIRETCLYLRGAITPQSAIDCRDAILEIVGSYFTDLPYVNMWLAYLLMSPSFNAADYNEAFNRIISLRDKALISIRASNKGWVKTHKNGLDTLGPYEKRAVLFSSQILSVDERKVWLGVAKSRGDVLEVAIADHLMSLGKIKKTR